MLKSIILALFVLDTVLAQQTCFTESNNASLLVSTRTGTFIGDLNDTYPDVRQFKNIPYAKPPVGPLRWASPQRLDDSSEVYDSTVFGPACPQYISAIPTAWALNITGNLVVNYGQSLLAGEAAQNSAEDCLTIAIWTPANASSESNLPVIHFLTGGGDVTGGINIPTQLPSNWIHRSQRHIIVTTNYRVSIFSYPNARGLNGSTNFGLQDQRMAIEWVAENIAAFGGDPSRITLWGQSAGAGATDQYLYAHYQDPIIRASISSSGVAIGRASNADVAGTNFTFVAKSLGCDFCDPKLELECMRRVPMPRIENFVGQYQDNSTLVDTSQPPIAFTRTIDNMTVFQNYTERLLNGQIAKLPKIIGTTAREAAPLVPYPVSNYSAGPSEQLVYSRTLSTVCAAHNASVLLNQIDVPIWRYEWGGNFSNLAGGVPWLGAYHYADLYMLFGTYLITPGESSDLEIQTSERMQDLFLDFITDPDSLEANGWPQYQAESSGDGGGSIAVFGADGQVLQLVDGVAVEGACYNASIVYNTSP